MAGKLEDAIGPEWWNCCWLMRAPKWLVAVGESASVHFNPLIMNDLLFTLALVNCAIDWPWKEALREVLAICHNQMVVEMVALVGLYVVFGQRRPGKNPTTGLALGTPYGMPSGDAMLSGIIAAGIFDKRPVFASLLVILACGSRVLRGYHSILQVFAGLLTGIGISLGYFYIGSRFHLFCLIVSLFLPFITYFDKDLVGHAVPQDVNNLYAWTLGGLSVIVTDIVLCPRKDMDWFEYLSDSQRAWISIIGRVIFFGGESLMIYRGTTFCLV
jgi:membrane-associated phospholipid phosphatase